MLPIKLTYVNSVPSRLSDVTQEDIDVMAVGPSDCRQVDAETAVKFLVVGVHDGWWRYDAATWWDSRDLKKEGEKTAAREQQTLHISYGKRTTQ